MSKPLRIKSDKQLFKLNIKPTTLVSDVSGVADRAFVKMKTVGYVATGAAGAVYKNFTLYLNSITDPLGDFGNGKPNSQAAFALLYTRYRVITYTVDIQIMNLANFPVLAVFVPQSTATGDIAFNNISVEPYAVAKMVPHAASYKPTVLKQTMHVQKVFGVAKELYSQPEFNALFAANPASILYGKLHIESGDGTTVLGATTQYIMIQITQEVECFDRNDLDLNLRDKLVKMEYEVFKKYQEEKKLQEEFKQLNTLDLPMVKGRLNAK